MPFCPYKGSRTGKSYCLLSVSVYNSGKLVPDNWFYNGFAISSYLKIQEMHGEKKTTGGLIIITEREGRKRYTVNRDFLSWRLFAILCKNGVRLNSGTCMLKIGTFYRRCVWFFFGALCINNVFYFGCYKYKKTEHAI